MLEEWIKKAIIFCPNIINIVILHCDPTQRLTRKMFYGKFGSYIQHHDLPIFTSDLTCYYGTLSGWKLLTIIHPRFWRQEGTICPCNALYKLIFHFWFPKPPVLNTSLCKNPLFCFSDRSYRRRKVMKFGGVVDDPPQLK